MCFTILSIYYYIFLIFYLLDFIRKSVVRVVLHFWLQLVAVSFTLLQKRFSVATFLADF